MALSNALFAGVTGMQVNQVMLDVVGNNLANSNTEGFKSQRVEFEDLIYQTLSAGSASGTNPQQIGLGAAVGSIDSTFSQGALQTTGRTLDLAIQGTGFFVVNNGQTDLYTRAGSFSVDSQGYVVSSATGGRLQRTGSVGEATPTTPAFQVAGNNDIRIPLGVGIPGLPTSTVDLRGNLSTTLAVNDTYSTGIAIYDSQGTQHTLTLTFTKTAANTFSLNATVSGGGVTGVPFNSVTFNPDGTLAGPASVTIGLTGMPAAQTVQINLGTPNQGNGLTQFGSASSAAAINQDGSTAGTLVNYTIDQDGTIQGVFSNGRILPLAQVALAQFSNQGGLIREGNNFFSPSSSSGPALIGAPASGALGKLQSGTLEASNVNVGSEFTLLIIAQRGFQINARSVTISNEVLQELANLIH